MSTTRGVCKSNNPVIIIKIYVKNDDNLCQSNDLILAWMTIILRNKY